MINYNLTPEQERVLDALDIREYKSQREVGKAINISEKKVPAILKQLENKGLAGCNRTERTNWWFAL